MSPHNDPTHGRVYSPTTTEKWLRCPAFRAYDSRLHALDNDWSPAMLLGSAIGAGLAYYYASVQGRESRVSTIPHLVRDTVTVGHATLDGGYIPNDDWSLDALRKLVEKGLAKALTLDVLEGGLAKVAGTEIPVYDECRLDLLTSTPTGMTVTDWKVKFNLEKKWEDKTLREYDNSWQLLHYAWRVSEHYQCPVNTQIGMIVLQPTVRAVLYPVPTPPERIANWLQSAKTVWAQMGREERGEAVPFMRHNDACWRYGQCNFYALCHTFGGDIEAASMFYEPRQAYELRLQGRRAA